MAPRSDVIVPGLVALQRGDGAGRTRWVHFHSPETVLEAWTCDEVADLIRAAEAARAEGKHAVGWIAYEAAPAFDPALPCRDPLPGLPLVRFSIYREQHEGLPRPPVECVPHLEWTESPDQDRFMQQVHRIRAAIAAGETYQVNFTYPRRARFTGDPWSLFRSLRAGQAGRHQAFLDEGNRVILSASPELFFRLEKGHMLCRPMKGTAALADARLLQSSRKDRAENVMIVDMIRNDLGKVADKGSVRVSRLFEVEPYPSLLQLTSTVEARGPASVLDWLRALFPCASITGAPKRQTMRWIQELEPEPRGIYTGAIGGLYADGVTEFSVAIRTAVLDRSAGTLRYDSGCGIVWDSDPAREFEESRLKARVITDPAPDFSLIETLKWTPDEGCLLWPRHKNRLLRSAAALGFAVLESELDASFAAQTATLTAPTRLRLLADADGGLSWTLAPLPEAQTMTFALDTVPTPRHDPRLFHKTTRRQLYESARARHPEADETLLINEDGELMEFTIGTVILRIDGELLTPPVSSGLLPGVAREAWIEAGKLRETVLTRIDLERADAVYLLNAVRGRVEIRKI